MKKMLVTVLLSLLFGAGVPAETLKGTGEASFSVRATGHTVHGTAPLQPFDVTVTDVDGDKQLSFNVDAAIAKMTTNKKARDEEMYHVLHEDEHPMIHGAAKDISLAALKAAGDEAATFPFTFELAGVETENTATVLDFTDGEKGMELKVSFDVSQLEYFLTPIKKMGFLKVADTVHVEVLFTMAH